MSGEFEEQEFEELEHIPWSALAASGPDPRWRLAAIAAGGLVLLALLAFAAKSLLPSGQAIAPMQSLEGAAGTHPAPTETSLPVPVTEIPMAASAPASGPSVYSEADLEAVSVDEEVLLAAMWAESLARDYLTIDGDGSAAEGVATLFGIELPAAEPGVASYVEWVKAFSVTATEPAVYRVDVAYRLLIGQDSRFVRQPAAAMTIEMSVDIDGSVRLRQLPETVSLPELTAVHIPDLVTDLPQAVVEAVDGARILGGYEVDGGWHVVTVSELAPGVERPSLVTIEG
ncbi:MAG: hypothetical protein QNJ77_02000 [Acidimicrobiia bacterium]|nr:hypothetical protein [Acidimicrobiia bacterium]